MASLTPVSDATFQSEVLDSTGLVLVDFWAPWCGPCRQVAPILDKLSAEYEGRIEFRSLNVDENVATSSSYRVTGIPTLKIFRDGEEVLNLVGARPEAALRQEFEAVLSA